MTEIVNIAGHIVINWNSGATATLYPRDKEIQIHFETPTNGSKFYTLVETKSERLEEGKKTEKQGMILK